ncbi:hypothetical protein C0Q70_05144 [Pomacea canaliculata]|uniref:Uncharacterized protein n=1 Tax=Pomacea canaliculata TaxID=400727 RepID=A0A2T7PKF7_POMCA|nr:hypothetical protein C0Q70_05144 [Pomacea canaliculata]
MYLRGKRTKRTNAETRAATAGESQRDVHTEVAQSSCSRSAPTGGSYVCNSTCLDRAVGNRTTVRIGLRGRGGPAHAKCWRGKREFLTWNRGLTWKVSRDERNSLSRRTGQRRSVPGARA